MLFHIAKKKMGTSLQSSNMFCTVKDCSLTQRASNSALFHSNSSPDYDNWPVYKREMIRISRTKVTIVHTLTLTCIC